MLQSLQYRLFLEGTSHRRSARLDHIEPMFESHRAEGMVPAAHDMFIPAHRYNSRVPTPEDDPMTWARKRPWLTSLWGFLGLVIAAVLVRYLPALGFTTYDAVGAVVSLLSIGATVYTFKSAQSLDRDLTRLTMAVSAPSLLGKIEALRGTLASSGSLIAEINAELELQATSLERIKAEAEENQRLAALNQDEAEAVRKLVKATIEGAQTTTANRGRRQQWLFFLAGLFASVPLGVAANFAFDFVKAGHWSW
jgi:hypothetical protein